MYIGCNWSNALGFLITKEEVNVDYIKTGVYGNFSELFPTMRSKRPILLHGLGYFEHTGMENIDMIDFDQANHLIDKCNSPHYGIHLAINNSDMHSGMSDEEIHKRMSKQIRIFKNKLHVPLLLENIPDSPQDRYKFDHYPYYKPEQITRLLVENEVSFLLDLTHAKITAQYHNWNVYEYLRQLPLDLVAEIHVNGSGYDEESFPADTHQAMENEDYRLLEWVLNYTNPDIVTLEYNGVGSEDEDIILKSLKIQLKKINDICNSVS